MYKLLNFLIAATILSSTVFAHEEVVRFAHEDEWPPYSSQELAGGGAVPTILKKVIRPHKIRESWGAWSDVFKMAQEGKVDCLTGAYYKKERTKDFIYSTPYLTIKSVLVTSKELEITFPFLSELKGVKTGIIKGYVYPEKITKASGIPFIEGATLVDLLEMLKEGKVGAIIADKEVVKYHLDKKFPKLKEKIHLVEMPLYTSLIHVICSKKNPHSQEVIDSFNKNFKKMRDSGEIGTITDKYLKK